MGCQELSISHEGLLHQVTTDGQMLNKWSTLVFMGKISSLRALKKEKL
jgi:hypothetical protein